MKNRSPSNNASFLKVGIVLGVIIVVAGGVIGLRLIFGGVQEVTHTPGGFGSADSVAVGSASQKNDIPVKSSETGGKENAKVIFTTQNDSLGTKFAKLSALAEQGDPDARAFAFHIASQCRSMSTAPALEPGTNAEDKIPYREQLRAQIMNECDGVFHSASYQRFLSMIEANPSDVFAQPIKQAIRQQFADVGPAAALDVAVSAIKERPDSNTVFAVADELSNLDISSIYMQSDMKSVAAWNPAQRKLLMRYAMQLFACDFGAPCGPTSLEVRSLCIALSACVPGADLQQVYFNELLTGQQARDVRALLERLREAKPSISWSH